MQDHHWKLTIRFSVVKDSMLARDSSGNLQKHKCHFRVEQWRIQGRDPGDLCPPLFLDQTEAQRAENIFFWRLPPPLSQGLDDPPSLSWSGSATVEVKEKKQSRTLAVKIIIKKYYYKILFFKKKHCLMKQTNK